VTQLDLDSEARARAAAIQSADDHSNPSWNLYARHVIEHVARTNATFISDAVWDAGLGKPPEARALGAVMRWAQREGLIAPTNETRPSAQAGCHQMPRRVWRSLVFETTS
jgi:hypothetical protein